MSSYLDVTWPTDTTEWVYPSLSTRRTGDHPGVIRYASFDTNRASHVPARNWRPFCRQGRRPLATRDRRRLRRRRGERAVLNARSRSRQAAIAGPISGPPHHLLRPLSGSLGRALFSSSPAALPAGLPSPLSAHITSLHRQEAIRQPKRAKVFTNALVYGLEHPSTCSHAASSD